MTPKTNRERRFTANNCLNGIEEAADSVFPKTGVGVHAGDGVYTFVYPIVYTEAVMVALSIKLPQELAEMSRQVARKLGITRSELIRQALVHEIEHIEASLERRAMAESLRAMAGTDSAARENDALDQALDEVLPEEKEGWWSS